MAQLSSARPLPSRFDAWPIPVAALALCFCIQLLFTFRYAEGFALGAMRWTATAAGIAFLIGGRRGNLHWRRFPPRVLAAFACATALVLLPYAAGIKLGRLTTTFGDFGLDPDYPVRAATELGAFLITAVLGLEIVFRTVPLTRLIRWPLALRVWSLAVLFTVCGCAGWWPHFQVAGMVPVASFLLCETGSAAAAGWLFVLGRNPLLSGLWTGIFGFARYRLVNDIELTMDSGYYLTIHSHLFYWGLPVGYWAAAMLLQGWHDRSAGAAANRH